MILNVLRTERDHKIAIMMQKTKVNRFQSEYLYFNYLTSYASEFVIKQLSLIDKVANITENDGEYTVSTSEGLRSVSCSKCDCIFNKSMILPCRHIFALRRKLELSLFDPSLCDKRWTFDYYKATHRFFTEESSDASGDSLLVTSSEHSTKLSQHQKYRQANVVCNQLASVASYASNVHFERRVKLLEELLDYWKCGKEVALTELETGTVNVFVSFKITCVNNINFLLHVDEDWCSTDDENERNLEDMELQEQATCTVPTNQEQMSVTEGTEKVDSDIGMMLSLSSFFIQYCILMGFIRFK